VKIDIVVVTIRSGLSLYVFSNKIDGSYNEDNRAFVGIALLELILQRRALYGRCHPHGASRLCWTAIRESSLFPACVILSRARRLSVEIKAEPGIQKALEAIDSLEAL
jgi:hypothetical protein